MSFVRNEHLQQCSGEQNGAEIKTPRDIEQTMSRGVFMLQERRGVPEEVSVLRFTIRSS